MRACLQRVLAEIRAYLQTIQRAYLLTDDADRYDGVLTDDSDRYEVVLTKDAGRCEVVLTDNVDRRGPTYR